MHALLPLIDVPTHLQALDIPSGTPPQVTRSEEHEPAVLTRAHACGRTAALAIEDLPTDRTELDRALQRLGVAVGSLAGCSFIGFCLILHFLG